MTFQDAINECLKNTEFVRHWARLRNVNLATTSIERMIDNATGTNDETARLFIADVYDIVWCRIPRTNGGGA